MKTTIVRYKVKPERADENRALIRDVFAELERDDPDDVRYVSFNLDDGVTFVHIAVSETADGSNPLPKMGAFRKFVADIGDRCDEAPLAAEGEIIGSYRLFWQKTANAG